MVQLLLNFRLLQLLLTMLQLLFFSAPQVAAVANYAAGAVYFSPATAADAAETATAVHKTYSAYC